MKKQFCGLLAVLLLSLTLFPASALAAEQDDPALSISCAWEDNALTVTVGIVKNPGIAGVDLALHFNDTVLAPCATPEMAEGWTFTTNYTAPLSGNTLKVVGAREENVTENGTLFTVSFTVKDSGSYTLSVDGAACTEGEELIELLPAYVDDFGVKTAAWENNRLTVTLVSCGSGYHGSGKAMLVCYDGGKFVGCKIADFTVNENETEDVTFDVGALSGSLFRLMLTDERFAPQCAAVEITPD